MAMARLRGRVLPATPVVRDVGTGVLAGILGGLCAGLALVFVLLVEVGQGPLYGFQLVASFVLGDVAFGRWAAVASLLGMAMLASTALAWGVFFGIAANLLESRSGWSVVALAIGVGVLAQIVHLYLFVPVWQEAAWGRDRWADAVGPGVGWVVHLVYALGLCAFPWLYRALWGVRPRNWYGRRRYDPFDPLGA